jgi:ribonuclease Z
MTMGIVEGTEVLFLGTDSVVPSCGHDTASFIINRRYLVDTGWSAALRMQCWGVSPLDIEYLFLTHCHHDHYLGLPQLLFYHAMRASDKRQDAGPLKIVGPAEDLERVVTLSLQFLQPDLFPPVRYEPELIPLKPGDTHETAEFNLSVCRAPHPVPALCYRFEDVKTNQIVTFTGDTAYDPAIVSHASGASLLIHEASYGENAAPENNPWLHSGAPEAARVAVEAGVHKLALIHCSEPRQRAAVEAAKVIFPNTIWPADGETVVVN